MFVHMSKSIQAQGSMRPTKLTCEYQENPLGIDATAPRLSWKIEEEKEARGIKQTAYYILVASTAELLAKDQGDLWNSGKISSEQSIQVEYAGKPLESRRDCFWKVRIWQNNGKPSAWSYPAKWSMGLLKNNDWQAKWIKAKEGETSPWLRKEFSLSSTPEQASVFVNVKGYYELYVNGNKVSDDVLSPAVSVLKKRTLYNTYDISKLLHKGNNCVGIWLGLGLDLRGEPGPVPLARVQLEMKVKGQRKVIGTDSTWTCMPSTHTEFGWDWGGNGREIIDERKYVSDWSKPGLSAKWNPVEVYAGSIGTASAQSCSPTRVTKIIPAFNCTALKANTYELDFGTNLTGWLRLRLPKMNEGDTVKIFFADKKFQNPNGETTPAGLIKPHNEHRIETSNGPVAYQTFGQEVKYISAGKKDEEYCGKFNYAGFRYAIIKGLSSKPSLVDAEALMIESNLEKAGSFKCSNDLINKIYETNLWTIRCLNLGGYMVDCPHRERMGYGGDGQTSIDAQMMSLDASSFYSKWAIDWLDVQDSLTGKSAQFAPVNNDQTYWIPWGGMIDVLPWKVYLYYGDHRLLERAYKSMVNYTTKYVESLYPDGINREGGGDYPGCDWVTPAHGMTNPPGTELFLNCYRVYLFDLLTKSADALKKADDARNFQVRMDKLKTLINSNYCKNNTKFYYGEESLDFAMPLLLGIVPEYLRGTVMKKLEETIKVKNQGHLDTGMLGSYFLFEALMKINRNDLAYNIVNQKGYPGWGYQLSRGATTFGEQWNLDWSQIHACYLNPGGWFYQSLAGICPDEKGPGFKRIIIKPEIVGDLEWVNCSYNSIQGVIVSNWKRNRNQLTMDISIPPNTSATVYVPTVSANEVTESGKPIMNIKGVKYLRLENGAAVYAVGSGTYRFQSSLLHK